jgi:hypothetical protein
MCCCEWGGVLFESRFVVVGFVNESRAEGNDVDTGAVYHERCLGTAMCAGPHTDFLGR